MILTFFFNFSIFFCYYFYASIGLAFKSSFWIIFISIHIFRKWQWRHHYYNRRGPSFSGQIETCFSWTFVRSSYIYRGFNAKLPNFGWIVFHTHHGLKHILTFRQKKKSSFLSLTLIREMVIMLNMDEIFCLKFLFIISTLWNTVMPEPGGPGSHWSHQ